MCVRGYMLMMSASLVDMKSTKCTNESKHVGRQWRLKGSDVDFGQLDLLAFHCWSNECRNGITLLRPRKLNRPITSWFNSFMNRCNLDWSLFCNFSPSLMFLLFLRFDLFSLATLGSSWLLGEPSKEGYRVCVASIRKRRMPRPCTSTRLDIKVQ